MKSLWSLTHPYLDPNLYDFINPWETDDILKKNYLFLYLQTQFQKSWDTVQIVNKNRMQLCGSFKCQYFIQNTT